MNERERQAQEFERRRPRMRAVAYRMLGSLSEADDAVQEAWLRYNRADTEEVESLIAAMESQMNTTLRTVLGAAGDE